MTTDSNEVEKEIMKLKKEIMIIDVQRQRLIDKLHSDDETSEELTNHHWDAYIDMLYEYSTVIRYFKSQIKSKKIDIETE